MPWSDVHKKKWREKGRCGHVPNWHGGADYFLSAMHRWFTTRLFGQDGLKSFVWMITKMEDVMRTRKNLRRKREGEWA
jgi:hypothetical protein